MLRGCTGMGWTGPRSYFTSRPMTASRARLSPVATRAEARPSRIPQLMGVTRSTKGIWLLNRAPMAIPTAWAA